MERFSSVGKCRLPGLSLLAALVFFVMMSPAAYAQLDGHGPDAWRVAGLTSDQELEARMGPGVQYPVIETFQGDERGLQQITCVPYFTFEIYQRISPQERAALGPRWCLMHNEQRTKAGWVPQAFLMEDSVDEIKH